MIDLEAEAGLTAETLPDWHVRIVFFTSDTHS
jgi:hypothetical protein